MTTFLIYIVPPQLNPKDIYNKEYNWKICAPEKWHIYWFSFILLMSCALTLAQKHMYST
jgi:hypothetical protein